MPINLPNFITIGRILLVPITVWLIISGEFLLAFGAFVSAGISDGVDGFIAKRFGLQTELGAYLDPLADKLLLVSIFVSLGMLRVLPPWVVILVVSRDVLIVGGVLLAKMMNQSVRVQPMFLSKLNTAAQIALAGVVLAVLGFDLHGNVLVLFGSALVAALTVASGAQYVLQWIRHMASNPEPPKSR